MDCRSNTLVCTFRPFLILFIYFFKFGFFIFSLFFRNFFFSIQKKKREKHPYPQRKRKSVQCHKILSVTNWLIVVLKWKDVQDAYMKVLAWTRDFVLVLLMRMSTCSNTIVGKHSYLSFFFYLTIIRIYFVRCSSFI